MKNLSKLAITLLCLGSKALGYRDMDIKFNPFVCLNECDQDESPVHAHKKPFSLRDDPACPDNDHKITSLPYWDKTQTLPCMYSGTLNVSMTDKQDHNLFYWHFKNTALTNPPLVVWINGGPGSTSMFGLFLENGPLQINKNGPGVDDFILGLNKAGSWVDIADMIFLD